MSTKKTSQAVLDEIATSIKQLTLTLDTSEADGRRLAAAELDAVARRLQNHVEALLALAKQLRDGDGAQD